MIKRAIAVGVAIGLMASGAAEAAAPNILVILADDLGFSDVGCYGGEIDTPNIDSLAAGGLRYTQGYDTARCWPSRAALLTGYYAQAVRRDSLPGIKRGAGGRRGGAGGRRPDWARLLPEYLAAAGYRCYHSGKWHIDGDPQKQGFHRSLDASSRGQYNYFDPRGVSEDGGDSTAGEQGGGGEFYVTEAIGEHAVRCLAEHARDHAGKPFFHYVAFTAPHFPLHALADDIAKYRDRYREGWELARAARSERLAAKGIVTSPLSAVERDLGPPYAFKDVLAKTGPGEVDRPLPWESLTRQQQDFQAMKMAIHAAMVDCMDRQIGLLLAQLSAAGVMENTLILFASDNGASAEMMIRGEGHDPDAPPGSRKTHLCLGPGWSTVANTPFRRHKTWTHEGGIATPWIVHWPAGITAAGELRRAMVHLVDVVPTVLELAGIEPPEEFGGRPVPPMHGRSFAATFAGGNSDATTAVHESLWWCHEGHRAVRQGDWKIVAAKGEPWELYDLAADRCETTNLADEQPERVEALAATWNETAETCRMLATGEQPAARPVKPAAEAAGSKRPNIIYVMTDDQGYGDLAAHGNPIIQTPVLDRLREQSVRLCEYHVSPTCSPTRAAMLTGRHEFRSGVTHTILERERLALSATTLPQLLTDSGYATGIFGKWHLGDEDAYQPGRRGFQRVFIHGGGGIGQTYPGSCGDCPDNSYFSPVIRSDGRFVKTEGYCTDVFFREASAWIDECREAGRPFFCYIPTNAPHGPFNCPPGMKQKYLGPLEAAGIKNPKKRDEIARFYAMIENIDANMGRLLAKLERDGLAENTLVVFTSDNGSARGAAVFNDSMRGAKGSPHRGGTRVPSFWRWKGHLPEGLDLPQLFAHIDILPTICEITGTEIPDELAGTIEGRSFAGLLRGAKTAWPARPLVTHTGRWNRGEAAKSAYRNCRIREGNWQLVNTDNDPAAWQLYDIAADPGEQRDVAAEHPEIVERLAAEYDRWWASVQEDLVNEDLADFDTQVDNPFKTAYRKQFGDAAASGRRRPNILFVIADDQSPFDFRFYNEATTLSAPVIERLAAEGMVLDAAYHMGSFSGAVCTPSRHMVMSGRGVWHLPIGPHAGALAPPNLHEQSLAAVFNAAGYETMRTCKRGNSYPQANAEFSVRREATKRAGTAEGGSAWHAEAVLDYLDERATSGDRDPFLIYLGFSHPHDTRDGTPELLGKYAATNHADRESLPPLRDGQPPLPPNWLPGHPFDDTDMLVRDERHVSGVWNRRDEATIRNELGREFACSENIDRQLGRVLERLEATGELENTWIFYTADHGIAIGRHGLQGKQNLYEHTWRVPFVVKGPGITPGSRARGNIYLADVLATLCEIAGISPPESNEGRSFLPVLTGKAQAVRDVLYGVYSGGAKPGIRAVRKGDWKLIEYASASGGRHTQLFNLAENPHELLAEHHQSDVAAALPAPPEPGQRNLADDPAHANQRREMERLLAAEMRRHDDPYRIEGLEGQQQRPNFVVILIDDLGYADIGPFGASAQKTPALDRMAAEGMRFTSFYAAPVCSVSRAQLLTGCYGPRTGTTWVYGPASGRGLNPAEMTIAERLRRQGYTSAAIGKWHLGDQPAFLPGRQGFDRSFGIPYSNDMQRVSAKTGQRVVPLLRNDSVIELLTDEDQRRIVERCTDEAVRFIEQSHEQGRPFFLYLPHTAVHVPIHPGERFAGTSDNGRYGDWVQEVDWSVGRVLETLRERGLAENTLVVFTSDNGPWTIKGADGGSAGPLRGSKGSTWEGGVRVPTICWWPGTIAPGGSCDAVAGTIDLLPTFVSLAGGSLPASPVVDGRDLSGLLQGESESSPRKAHYYFHRTELQAVREGRWKLTIAPQVEHPGPSRTPVAASPEAPRLYDLDADLGERENLAAAHPQVVERLLGLAESMRSELAGPAPAGRRAEGRVAHPVPLFKTASDGKPHKPKPPDKNSAKTSSTTPAGDTPRPNIVWLSVEDMSPWIGPYGDTTVPTSNLDRLAREGVVYENAFATSPVCAPARSSLITGMFCTRIGTMQMRNGSPSKAALASDPDAYRGIPGYEGLPPAFVRCFPERLRAAGYYCTNNAKKDYQFREPVTVWDESSKKAHWKNRGGGQPFFAVFNYTGTHESQAFAKSRRRPQAVAPRDVPLPPFYPDTPAVRDAVARTYDNIAAMDRWVGERIDELEEAGLLESTVVFFFSDHGVGLPRGKRSCFDTGLRVPLLVRLPGAKVAGSRESRVVSFVDFGPSVLSLAGLEPDSRLDGTAFLGPFATERNDYRRGHAYANADRFDSVYDRVRSVSDGRYRYTRNYLVDLPYMIRNAYREQLPMMADLYRLEETGPQRPEQWQLAATSRPAEELYDATQDPWEVKNLIDAPEHRERLARLRGHLEAWIADTGDLGFVLPETRLVEEKIWPPEGRQPATPAARIDQRAVSRGQGMAYLVRLSCDDSGASIGYRAGRQKQLSGPWRVATGPLELPADRRFLEVQTHRIGHRPTTTSVFLGGE